MDFEAYRDEFPIFRTKAYLNTCSLGPLSHRARAAVLRFLDDWDDLGAHAWYERWLEALDRTRTKFARLVGARREEVALAPSVSHALAVVAGALDYRGRPEVVSNELDFPTIPYQWRVRPGCRVHLVESEDTVTVPTAAMVNALGERTAAVATTHVFFATGYVQDVAAIARAARRAGAISIVDGYHATGQLPVDVRALGVDAYISGSLKWLLGGPGLAFLCLRSDLVAALEPAMTGWFANAHQFDFDPRRFAFREDARRFELGTPANAAVFAAEAGLDPVSEVGVGRIRRRTLDLANDLVERAEDAGLQVRAPPPDVRTGIVTVEHADAPGAVQRLAAEGLVVDHRGSRVRLSPYFYNTFRENERAVDLLGASL